MESGYLKKLPVSTDDGVALSWSSAEQITNQQRQKSRITAQRVI